MSTPHVSANEGHLDRLDRLRQVPAPVVLVASIIFLAAIFAIDWRTGPDLQLLIFYLLPVLAMTWRFNARVGEATVGVVVIGSALANLFGPGGVAAGVGLWNATARFVFLSFVVGLVSRQRSVLDDQRRQATVDPLTGALNRRAFYAACRRQFDLSRRQPRPLALLYLDVNGLKRVNDTIGHEAGDRLLQDLARVIEATCRTTDVSARLGGDEFAVLLPDTDLDEGEILARRLIDALATNDPPLAASMGLVAALHPPIEVEPVVRQADQLMYAAKQSGGGIRSARI